MRVRMVLSRVIYAGADDGTLSSISRSDWDDRERGVRCRVVFSYRLVLRLSWLLRVC
jgi:hypothetical protein